MNRSRARIVVRARDPLLRSQIEERLAGLGDVTVETPPSTGYRGMGTAEELDGSARGEDASVEALDEEPVVTPRESEVLGLLADGLANKEIGGRLGISAHTAKFHVESLLRKLGAVNRAEAVREGIRRGLIGV
jgi:DNA-binding CsgD family transcriptional regulator